MKNNKKIFYGYIIIASGWLAYFFTTGASSYGSSVVSTKLVLDRGWSEGMIGLSSGALYLAVAIFSIPISVLIKKIGCRKTIIVGSIVGIIAYTGLRLFSDQHAVYILMFGLMGICSSACGMTTGPALITNWFREKRAMAMSIFYTSGAIAGFIMPQVATGLSNLNPDLCWIVFGLEALAALILAVFVVRDDPKDKGTFVDGIEERSTIDCSEKRENKATTVREDASLRIGDCYRSKRFYALIIQTFVSRLVHTGIVSYITIFAVQRGVAFSQAALLITIYSVSNFLGRCVVGVSGKLPFSRKCINVIGFAVAATGAFALPFSFAFGILVLDVAFAGFGIGLSYTIFPLLVADCFGDDNFPVLYGTYNTLGTIGSSASPMFLMFVAELTGGAYSYAYLAIAVLAVIAVISAIFTPISLIQARRKVSVD